MTNHDFFKIYAHNIPVKGKIRSAVYNLQQGAIIFIPTILYDILQCLSKQSLKEVQIQYAPENDTLFRTYIQFLLDRDLGFITKEPEKFPKLSLCWSLPCTINTAVIDYHFDHYDIKSAIDQLDNLLCKHIELRVTLCNSTDVKHLTKLLRYAGNKVFRSLCLLIDYHPTLEETAAVDKIYRTCQKIEHIIVYNAPTNITHQNIRYVQGTLESLRSHKNQYIVNTHYFLESQQFNPYYNQKVCINREGDIKNCLRHKRKFGNINHSQIADVVNGEAFRELWYATPDKIEGVKDSELRYCLFMPYELVKDACTGYYKIKESLDTITQKAIYV